MLLNMAQKPISGAGLGKTAGGSAAGQCKIKIKTIYSQTTCSTIHEIVYKMVESILYCIFCILS